MGGETDTAGAGSLRARFLSSVAGHISGTPVFVPDLSYWLSAHRQSWSADLQAQLAFHHDLGVMPYYLYGAALCRLSLPDSTLRSELVGENVSATVWDTPWGSLRKEVTALPESATEAITRYPVTTSADLRTLVQMLDHARMVPLAVEAFRKRDSLFARFDGYPIVSLPRSPLPALLTDWAGVMTGIVLMADHPDPCREFFRVVERLCLQGVEIVCTAGPPVVHVCDNLTSDVYTPYYAALMAPYYRVALRRLHQSGIQVVTHLDGATRGLLKPLGDTGFDGIEALTPLPVGDLDCRGMRELAGPNVVLWGGLPGAMFAPPWSWEELRVHLLELLDAWRGTPFIVGIADQLPPDGDVEMVRRIVDLLEST